MKLKKEYATYKGGCTFKLLENGDFDRFGGDNIELYWNKKYQILDKMELSNDVYYKITNEHYENIYVCEMFFNESE